MPVSSEWGGAVGLQKRVCMDAAQYLSLHSSRYEGDPQACLKTCLESSAMACLWLWVRSTGRSPSNNSTFLAKHSYRLLFPFGKVHLCLSLHKAKAIEIFQTRLSDWRVCVNYANHASGPAECETHSIARMNSFSLPRENNAL